jgi:PAT family beta-lactamase induction signal transducer AmpG
MTKNQPTKRNPWAWIPTLYFAEGTPYVVVMTVAVIMFKRFGISNTDIALYTSWLYLPWVIKPLWSPIVDLLKTKRWWIVVMQLIIGASLGAIALSIPLPGFFKISLIFFWLLAFSSATHDIAADGFYMLGLDEHQQAYFVGIRSTFYRIAMITGQGLLIILAGFFETSTGLPPLAVNVSVSPTTVQELKIPDISASPLQDTKTYFATFPEKIELSTQNIASEKLDSIRKIVTSYNQENQFVASTTHTQATSGSKSGNSLWSSVISTPLKNFLQNHFGKQNNASPNESLVGNISVVAVKLNGKVEPGKEIVLNLKFRSGDNSIRLIDGERLTFNSANQDKPAFITFQCDPKLKTATQASFNGTSGNIHLAWSITFIVLAALFAVFALYHKFILPHPKTDKAVAAQDKNLFKEFFNTFSSFFKRKDITVIIAFLIFYRFGEAQLIKLASPFMLDPRNVGGLGLTTGEVGLLYGTFGILALTIGGILGGIAASTKGFRYWLWWMVMAINIPHLAYVYMSFAQPENQLIIGLCVVIEQFSYGFGFTAYMLYMIYISEGKNKTAHFAIATGFMALGMMLPGMFSGWLQDIVGYRHFFIWVMLCMIPGMIPVFFINVKPEFGIKKKEENTN